MRSPERSPTRAAADPPLGEPVATVIVCTSCRRPDGADVRPRPGERLAEATHALAEAEGAGVRVETAECLGNCRRRLSAAVLAPGKWSYVFGDLLEDGAADLLLGARLLLEATDDVMPWQGRPASLKRGLVARLPPSLGAPAAPATPETPAVPEPAE